MSSKKLDNVVDFSEARFEFQLDTAAVSKKLLRVVDFIGTGVPSVAMVCSVSIKIVNKRNKRVINVGSLRSPSIKIYLLIKQ